MKQIKDLRHARTKVRAVAKKAGFSLSRFNGTDLSKIVYPLTILLTGWYIVSNIYRLMGEWAWAGGQVIYTMIWTLIPIAFVYLWKKGYKLKFKWGLLSAIGIILIIVFAIDAIMVFLEPSRTLEHIFLTGQWDHTFFPMAFGFFFLSDLSKLPRNFWWVLTPFAIFCMFPNLEVAANMLFETSLFEGFGPPGLFTFFNFGDVAANTWAEIFALPTELFVIGWTHFLQEFLTFFTLFPAVILYNLKRSK